MAGRAGTRANGSNLMGFLDAFKASQGGGGTPLPSQSAGIEAGRISLESRKANNRPRH
jgi:hypothetical protein